MNASDFISLRDFQPDDIVYLLELACRIKANPQMFQQALPGKTLALILEKPSLRTRVSFEVAIHQLGGFPLYLSPAEINLGKRESLYDVARNLERMVQGIMIRTFVHEIAERMAEYASIPVINGLTDYSHPCQAMGDFLTLLELKGRVRGLRLAYVGDGNNVCHSLMFAGAQLGAQVRVATPPGCEPKPDAVEWSCTRADLTGGVCSLTNDPVEAVCGADAVYTDVWTSMGREAEAAARQPVFAPFQVNRELFERAKPDAVFMHCLPAHRGEEVTDEVIDGPRSVVFHQAENRLHIEKAILFELMRDRAVEPLEMVAEAAAHA